MVREEKPLEIYVSLSQQCRKTNDVTHVISFFCTVNTLQGRLMGDVLVVGAVRKRGQRKMHCSVWGGGSIGTVQDLPERNTAEEKESVEAPGGQRNVEVMWLRKGIARRKEERRCQRIRGPLSLA